MPIRLYNSLSREVEDFSPAAPPKVEMFVCGPTVYDFVHIGNARTFTSFDVLAQWLRYRDFEVTYLQNITDIDDKIINRAHAEDTEPLILAQTYYEAFIQDMRALSNDAVTRFVRATEHIPEVLSQIKTLRDKGNVYLIEGDGWYFDLSTFANYGKLSGRTELEDNDAVSRIDENPNKRNVGDFAVWKLSKPNEPSWKDDELGAGRPGWHIEDTAMTEHHFGPQYDLHGGAADLKFPHHEAEIALQESASGKVPFVRHWMHAGFLEYQSGKMSKSEGNIISLREALERWPAHALRLFFMSAHYRSPLAFSDASIAAAEAASQRISEFTARLRHAERSDGPMASEAIESIAAFEAAMDDDLNTPKAIGHLFDVIRIVNTLMDDESLTAASGERVEQFVQMVSRVLGIVSDTSLDIPDDINDLVAQRQAARKGKDYESSDVLREELGDKGWIVDDTQYGPLVKRKVEKK